MTDITNTIAQIKSYLAQRKLNHALDSVVDALEALNATLEDRTGKTDGKKQILLETPQKPTQPILEDVPVTVPETVTTTADETAETDAPKAKKKTDKTTDKQDDA